MTDKSKKALDQLPDATKMIEPVYANKNTIRWILSRDNSSSDVITMLRKSSSAECSLPMYTTPPKRKWVGLTDEEVQLFADNYLDVGDGEGGKHYVCGDVDFARAIEAKLKEKNNG